MTMWCMHMRSRAVAPGARRRAQRVELSACHIPTYCGDQLCIKLKAAGYDHAFGDDGEIDMHGIAVVTGPLQSCVTSIAIEADQ